MGSFCPRRLLGFAIDEAKAGTFITLRSGLWVGVTDANGAKECCSRLRRAEHRRCSCARHMNRFGSTNEDNQPVTWWRGYALYATHLIVVVYVVSMLVTTLLGLFQAHSLMAWLPFTSEAVRSGEVWRIFSYGLINQPSLGFALNMVMLVWFGCELEKFFGRRIFLFLYGGIYLLLPLLFTVIGIWRPTMLLAGEPGAFAIFVAFATLFPGVPLIFNILAKWAAIILVVIYALAALARRDWVGLISLGATVGFAHAFVRYQQGALKLPSLQIWKRKPHLRVLPDEELGKPVASKILKSDSMAEVDALLDKIAHSGMASLTAAERAKLDRARDALNKRSRR